jgi:hypothetical protein
VWGVCGGKSWQPSPFRLVFNLLTFSTNELEPGLSLDGHNASQRGQYRHLSIYVLLAMTVMEEKKEDARCCVV